MRHYELVSLYLRLVQTAFTLLALGVLFAVFLALAPVAILWAGVEGVVGWWRVKR